MPGYVDLSLFKEFTGGGETTEVSVTAPLIAVASAAMKADNPDLSEMLTKLKLVSVREFPLKAEDTKRIEGAVDRIVNSLVKDKWEKAVQVKEKDESVHVFMKIDQGKIYGLLVMAVEFGKEATLVNIVGEIDPANLAKLSGKMNIPNLESLMNIKKPPVVEKEEHEQKK
jgi:hypothetical protein